MLSLQGKWRNRVVCRRHRQVRHLKLWSRTRQFQCRKVLGSPKPTIYRYRNDAQKVCMGSLLLLDPLLSFQFQQEKPRMRKRMATELQLCLLCGSYLLQRFVPTSLARRFCCWRRIGRCEYPKSNTWGFNMIRLCCLAWGQSDQC